jgi:membrane-associated protease RseP (regulator of RpoE activity)
VAVADARKRVTEVRMNIPGKIALAALLIATSMPARARSGSDPHDKTRPPAVVVVTEEGNEGDDGDTFQVEPPRPPDAPEAPEPPDAPLAPFPPRARVRMIRKATFLGVELVDITPALRTLYGAPKDAGVLVGEVEKDSPAARAGLEVGDVLIEVDGEKVTAAWNVSRAVSRKSPGASVELRVARKGTAKTLTLTAKVAERSGDETELRGWARDFDQDFGRDFGRDIGREVRRELRVLPRRIEVDSDRIAAISGDAIRKLRERVNALERRLKDLEEKKTR